MKGLSTFAVVAAMAVSSAAVAAPNKASKTKSTAVTSGATSESTSMAMPSAPAAAAATSTAAISSAPTATKKTTFALINSTYFNMEGTNKGKEEFTALNQVRANYQLSATEKLRINQIFTNEFGADVKSSEKNKIGDMYLQYAKSKLAVLPSDVEYNPSVRAYLPLSKGTRQKNQVTGIRWDNQLKKTFNKTFELAAHVVPWYSYQTTDSYFVDGKQKANSPFNLSYYLSGTVNLSKKISLVQEGGLMRYWYRSEAANGSTEKEFLYADTAVNYAINDIFEVGVGLSSYLARDLMAQKNKFAIYRGDETDYYFTGSASF